MYLNIFPPFRHFLKYLCAMKASQKLKVTTPDKKNQADFWRQNTQTKAKK